MNLEDDVVHVPLNGALLHQGNIDHLHIPPLTYFRTGVYMFSTKKIVEFKVLTMDIIESVQTAPVSQMPFVTGCRVIEIGTNNDYGFR